MVDKAWVHLCRADPAYESGAWSFVRSVSAALGDTNVIVCPCIDYRNVDRHEISEVVGHLVTRGMDEVYKLQTDWYHHGEVTSGTVGEAKKHHWSDEIYDLYRAVENVDSEMVSKDDLGEIAEVEDKKEDEFLAKFRDAETPLYGSCENHSKLSAIVSLFRLKTQNEWSDKSFNDLLETLTGMLPADNVLHTSLYEVKQFLKSFDMGYEKIHACVNDCCLFRKKYKKLQNCPKCNASRWKINLQTSEIKKGVPQKVLRYFPIIPRLKRMFRSEEMAKDLRWHFNNKSSDGKLCHLIDYVTWDQMNDKYPVFAAEERNIRLGPSTDGFNPFDMKNSRYSCWPVLLVNYNLPPHLYMKKENIMLILLIPGPHQPGNSIDIYLEPLIDDLCHLWTISDFPAYGNLDGCKVKGKMGCPVCGKHTDSTWLKFCRKHRSSRKRKKPGCVGLDSDGEDITSESEEDEEEVEIDEDELSRWKKRSIFFRLLYWEELPVRKNLDVMHVERNVASSIVSTLLHCGKSKDGLNARKDLEVLGIRKDLHPRIHGKRTYLPAAPWSLSKTEKKIFCKRLIGFKGPDGYCSNISRGVSLEDCKIIELKSHDYHVLMQQLLPVAMGGLLPKGLRIAISWICTFFNHLCQRVIDREQLLVMEKDIVETLYMFERFFPPSFFDIMVHLTVHLGSEARLGGPVHFRWMYPFERYMKVLKNFVRNPARPEGCIAESYLAEECMHYSNYSYGNGHENSTYGCHSQYGYCRSVCRVSMDSKVHEETLKWFAYGPRCTARSYTGYIVNGQRFHTSSFDRQTQNSGVFYEATAMCRSSVKDISHVVDWVSYYGTWAVRGNGVKVEDGFTFVNLNQSQGPSRRYSEEDVEDADLGLLPPVADIDIDMEEAQNARTDCEGIYV
ncbi:PREDICTED: uncharacterized protein LOC104754455 [Camelina sativa]|uniref:Uncharacterized protein LOC104754455 n=1 Tax=Camelina sativa TaxID=90675 RepID=A0ABM0WR30_CAMSA|nr:PREDICTED: uncharacterized protein LOC104754455 [Camelina sativa]